MDKCELYGDGRAFRVNGRAQSQSGYVYCSIARRTCPYNNEGHRIKYQDRVMIICNSNGLVEKAGLIEEREMRSIQQFRLKQIWVEE